MKKILFFVSLLLCIGANAQKQLNGKGTPYVEYPRQKYLEKANLYQDIFCSLTKDETKNDTFSYKVDTIYYFGKCVAYYFKKNVSYKFLFEFIYDNTKGDTLLNKTVQCKDSFLYAIPVKIEFENAHLTVNVTTVETKMRGIFPFRKMKDRIYSDDACEVIFKNYADKRMTTRIIRWRGCGGGVEKRGDEMQIHGYDINDFVRKVVPGVN